MTDDLVHAIAVNEVPAVLEPRVKVLLVDDRQDKRLALTAILDDLDIDLVMANSGRDALRMVLSHEFAVILLDVSMPIMDGFETATLIRQRKLTEHLPIIFITAFMGTDIQVSRGYALGAVDYIYTPVNPAVLRSKVQIFVDLFRKSREIKRQSELLRIESEFRISILEDRLEGILNRLHVGVYRLTREGILVSGNPSFFHLFDIDPAAQWQNLNFTELHLNSEERRVITSRLEFEGQVVDYTVKQRCADGSIRWISLTKSLFMDSQGIWFIDGLAEDVTYRKLAEEELMAKAEALARSNAELEQFAYVASHDLQEPLRTVSLYASLLDDRYGHLLDDRGRGFLNHLVSGATHMQELVRDILAYSKIGKIVHLIPVDCHQVVERVLFNLEDAINASGTLITQDPLPSIIGDSLLLGQVFQNLISNAIKFQHKDRQPTVHIGVERVGESWSFSIADNGIGIPAPHFEKIFSIFQRLHAHDKYAGTGIGLAICRKAIQQFGSNITLESELGSGSIFRFLLPCVPVSDNRLIPEDERLSSHP